MLAVSKGRGPNGYYDMQYPCILTSYRLGRGHGLANHLWLLTQQFDRDVFLQARDFHRGIEEHGDRYWADAVGNRDNRVRLLFAGLKIDITDEFVSLLSVRVDSVHANVDMGFPP